MSGNFIEMFVLGLTTERAEVVRDFALEYGDMLRDKHNCGWKLVTLG